MARELSVKRAKLTTSELEALRARLSGLGRRPETGVRRRPEGSEAVLSFAQQRLWFLDQFEPGSDEYNVGLGLRLRGELDEGALRRALEAVVERHRVLRTSFGAERGEPRLEVHGRVEVPWETVDLSGLPAEEAEAEATRRAAEEASRPFELGRAPLLRALLVRLGERERVLVVSFHHIVTDGWSQAVLERELGELYGAEVEGREARLAELEVEYEDYAHWQRERLRGEELERQLGYWRERLAGLEPLELPGDHPRPAVRSARGGSCELRLEGELTGRLRELGRRRGATLHQVLMAGLKVLLWRYTGQQDVAVGTVTAGRSRRELEELVGFFVNTLVIRSEVRGEESFEAVLEGVREASLGAQAHAEVPFEKLVDELGLERDPSRTPLFQVMCVLQNTPEGDLTLPGVVIEDYDLPITAAKCDLTLELQVSPEALSGLFVYSADLFERSTVERMAGHLGVVLRAIASAPGLPVRELPMLTGGERERLAEWNRTEQEYDRRRVHEQVAEWAAREPERVALVSGGRALTYGELNRRANRLAHHLRGLGVGRDEIVGVCAQRSLEMAVGLLGVMKAGGAYLPLDPGQPRERLGYLVAQSGTRVVLAEAEHLGLLREAARVEDLGEEHEGCPDVDPAWEVGAGDLAYVIYTSGSTGEPKGVMVEHRGLANLVGWHNRAYEVGERDRGAWLAAVSFDASGWERWPSLAWGASVAIGGEGVRRDLGELRGWLSEQRVSICFLATP